MMRALRRWLGVAVAAAGLLGAGQAGAQAAGRTIVLARGTSQVLPTPTAVQRIAVGSPEVADATAVSPREILLTGKSVGTTSLIVWDAAGGRRVYDVEVGVDAEALQRQVRSLFPGEPITVAGSGNTVILSGRVSSAAIGQRATELVRAAGATVIDNLGAPPPQQVMLQVRFAEVARTARKAFSVDARAVNPQDLGGDDAEWSILNAAGELLQAAILSDAAELEVLLRALKSRGDVRILAEPTLVAIEGQQASFLAGGEFPYVTAQASQGGTSYNVAFKEFGVRLQFLPVVTGAGNVRLQVAPEVSQLDFGNSVQISGFTLPALRTRRTQTAVELRPGQTLSIAGLMDNSLSNNVDKIPLLGDLPVLGQLFRSSSYQQQRTELIVLVTPTLVTPTDRPVPLPTGEPETWRWEPSLRGRANPAAQVPPAPR